ncbi:hypothetical protein PV326_005190 [Microctonus aethiopoides]|uniref:Importin N-terminal domain-containing protein n=1 Tax=Microctonus aethiopoides TaxID=144406 RepID=A0AA39FYN0_9HYME|nr:hypothetical protein PV326_005190 [Microctonus aethiopoides]KAK0178093.1 hypothetical protein PV328_002074 [Microctonus aethiopoides]
MNVAVIEVLEKACSQDPNVLKPAEQTLREWEIQRGFYTTLYNVFSNHSLPVNVRWMAVMYFKNGVNKYWWKNATNGIAEDEKEFLRRSLIASFDEPVNQIATYIAEIIGKIARLDFPREWDTLIPTLLEVIRGQNSIAQHRALLTLHNVVKTLASKRLLGDKQMFEQLTANMFNYILNSWNTYTESFLILASNGADENQIREPLEMALLLLRILRKLIVGGFSRDYMSESEDAMLFLKVIFERAKACLECRKTLMLRGIQVESLEKFIIHLTKVLSGSLEYHPYCYVELIPATLEFTVFYCFTTAGMPFTFEKFVIQCLNLIKSILINVNYRRSTDDSYMHPKHMAVSRAAQLRKEFFTPETLKEICSKLVTHYFLLTQSDFEMWDADPEGYAVDIGESPIYNLRACTRTVFVSMFPEFGKAMTPVLIDLMQTYYRPVDPNDWGAILMKDAVYLAVGLVAFDLWDDVDFDQWFSTTLKQELEIKDSRYRIIKRRVCWLIGKWTRVKLDPKLRPELYEMMIGALSSEEDLVVRLEASCTLRHALNDFQFVSEEFMPFLERIFTLLFNLLREVTECDTKMQVLYVLSFVIEQVGENIRPYVAPLSAYLPSLWQISENHDMLKCAIISTLVHYVKALRTESAIVEPMIVSMIGLSCDLNQDAHVYLLEDGLELWLAVLENATVLTTGMRDLFRNMPALLDCGLDLVTLGPALNVIQAYVLLSPREFIGEWGIPIVKGIKSILMDLRVQEVAPVIALMELILKVASERGAQLIKTLLGRIFEIVYFDEDDALRVMNASLVVIARVLISSPDVFAQVVSELTRKIGNEQTEETVLGRLIDIWLRYMSNSVSEKKWLKCLAIALCSLLNSNSPPVVFAHFSTIISNIVEVLNDIMVVSFNEKEGSYDSLLLANCPAEHQHTTDDDDEKYKSEHQTRLTQLCFEDPVHTVCLRDFLQNQLTTLRRSMRNDQFEQMISTLRPEIDQQLREHIVL